jgi:pyruvate dehydrogenase E1 component alpha subunit
MRRYLVDNGLASEERLDAIDAGVEATFDEALEFAEASPEPEAHELFTDVFKE